MSKKALFFDIDGTLYSEITRQVPQSAVLALKKARQNGNLVFINTGRTWCQTRDIRKECETDGMLCGCGTYIMAEGKVLYNRLIPAAETEKLKADMSRYGMDGVLEGVGGCYIQNRESYMPMIQYIRSVLTESGAFVPDGWENSSGEISKFCVVAGEDSDQQGFFGGLKGFDVIDRGGNFYECIPTGHSKATAIEFILKKYGIAKKDAWVFGDSMNDLSMFQYSMNSVLMGKHDKGLEPYAAFTTKTVEEDGIAYALDSLGMLRARAV